MPIKKQVNNEGSDISESQDMRRQHSVEQTDWPSKSERFKAYLESLKDSQETLNRITELAASKRSAYVLVGNTHQCVLATEKYKLWNAFKNASVVTSDSQILAFTYRILGKRRLEVVRGWELTLRICKICEKNNFSVALYGGSEDTLRRLEKRLLDDFPMLDIAAAISPPYRPLNNQEKIHDQNLIQASDARIILVGLGCPKQEMWMFDNHQRFSSVAIGVGAAFDFLAETIPTAPHWVHRIGFEWAWRFAQEPRRLGRRYLKYNPKFMSIAALAALSYGAPLETENQGRNPTNFK